jgi:hypothetical protein
MATKNATYLIGKSVAYGMFGTGLALSVTHIYDLFHSTLGAGVVTAAAVPMFVDGLQLIGRMARSHQFAESTRRTGFWVQLLGAAISLAANIIAGHSLGDKIAGAIFVIGYIGMEAFADKLRPVEQDVKAVAETLAATKKAAASASAKKAAATRRANAAAKARTEAERKERAKLSRLAKQAEQKNWDAMVETAAAAPVSPAPVAYEQAAYL